MTFAFAFAFASRRDRFLLRWVAASSVAATDPQGDLHWVLPFLGLFLLGHKHVIQIMMLLLDILGRSQGEATG